MKSDLHKFLDLASPAELEILWRRSPEALRPCDLIRLKEFVRARDFMGGRGSRDSQQLISLREVRVDGRPVRPGFDPQEGAVFYGLPRLLRKQYANDAERSLGRAKANARHAATPKAAVSQPVERPQPTEVQPPATRLVDRPVKKHCTRIQGKRAERDDGLLARLAAARAEKADSMRRSA